MLILYIELEEVSEVWVDEDGQESLEFQFAKEDEDTPPSIASTPSQNEIVSKQLSIWLIIFIVRLRSVFHLSDKVTDYIIKFLAMFLVVLGRFAPICLLVRDFFPNSLHQLNAKNNRANSVLKYVACTKCHSIYTYQQCIEGSASSSQKSKLCSFQPFPHHVYERMRRECGNALLKTVEFASGKKVLYPFMTYCYLGLESTLASFFQRPQFHEQIKHWKNRNKPTTSTYADIYDGQVWSEFQHYNGQPFLSNTFSLGLAINIDWFQPYKHVTYSVGAVYLVILNLPRSIRYKQENVILVGILPGPREPSRDINSYLRPLIEELLLFWDGVYVSVNGFTTKQKLRCALICAACDIPAGRKACGFIGHSGHLGCSRCAKYFPGTFGNIDYGGFDRNNWPKRTLQDHREAARRIRQCTTKSQQQEIESSTGYRNTILLELPYFNPTRMLVVDPMHNLFLGSAKHVLKQVWLENSIIDPDLHEIIQERIDKCVVPSDIGRIPFKVISGFSSFTADQFKNWVIYYSLISLHGILVGEELECWRHFVLGCRILLEHELTTEQVSLADALLLQFCRRIERMHGSSLITPNMHLHGHLKECILDYGPLHGFWCFPFERFNGLLGAFPNNNRSIEVQLLNRFLDDRVLMDLETPDTFADDFASFIPQSAKVVGTLSEISQFGHAHEVSLPKFYSNQLFAPVEIHDLQTLYSKLYPSNKIDDPICSAYRKYQLVHISNTVLGCHKSRSSSSSIVLAEWNHDLFGTTPDSTNNMNVEHRPVRINYFAQHMVKVDGKNVSHILACVSWFKKHRDKDKLGKPITVWECDIFENRGFSFIPMEYIVCRTVSLVDTIGTDGSHALIICPCVNF